MHKISKILILLGLASTSYMAQAAPPPSLFLQGVLHMMGQQTQQPALPLIAPMVLLLLM